MNCSRTHVRAVGRSKNLSRGACSNGGGRGFNLLPDLNRVN